ncbi:flagellar hook protein FlgE [Pseudoxanthomonas sp.]|uniref:flagellar hook protein FlgE n=1 Tax=Pseudoxanthomonas sp. TaxID=1871049 RepID=UPI002623B16A|nr:flagellar hook protein FlgE [Pseudoxanthomonas sp.]WDS36852.1 MAG: flagellar hook protein FlgE [Pseudoxanthomonas sp.]
MGFNTSLSGLRASNADLNVTSNNIANTGTTGFKESRAEFADIFMGGTYGVANNAVGSGARTADVAQQFKQGNIDNTGNTLDVAISGNGFFNVSNNGNALYTRSGNFQMDADGNVVTPDGYNLQVFAPNEDGATVSTASMTNLKLSTTDSSPNPTSSVSANVTLPANASAPAVATFDPANANSYNYSTSVTVYDSLGVSHVMTMYYVKTANANEWQQYTAIDGTSVSATPTTLTYSDSGKLLSPANGTISLDGYTPASGAGSLSISMQVGDSSQYGEAFAVNDLSQDGYAAGSLSKFEIAADGMVYASYNNGNKKLLGQIALTNFNNKQGLQPQGNNCWAATTSAGTPRTGAPGSSDFGSTQSGALEASTVDLTEQLVNMIVAQRNFQANAKMITTQDEITQTVINISR